VDSRRLTTAHLDEIRTLLPQTELEFAYPIYLKPTDDPASIGYHFIYPLTPGTYSVTNIVSLDLADQSQIHSEEFDRFIRSTPQPFEVSSQPIEFSIPHLTNT